MTMIRFETKGSHLIIEDVESEDAGVYVCIATNGFGSQRANIQLIVTGRTCTFKLFFFET